MEKLLLVGAGGHCRSVIDSIDRDRYSDIVIVDLPDMIGKNIFSIPVVGTDDNIYSLFDDGYKQAVITIGSIGHPDKRIDLYTKMKRPGTNFL
jgi:FlaA1/EpsC-like NDP-sugar epimerase